MSDLRELYQEVILDHSKTPRNFGKPSETTRSGEGFNPLCGDKVKIHVMLDGDVVKDIGFEGSGCAISTASASLMTENLKGKNVSEIEEMFERFRSVVTTPTGTEVDTKGLGKLAALVGVREFPMRVKCATLAWHTLHNVILETGELAKTE